MHKLRILTKNRIKYILKGDYYMINNCVWNIFKTTGNIEAFLYLKKASTLNNEEGDQLRKIRVEKIAVNDQAR